MNESELAIVRKCAAATCGMCDGDRWQAVHLEDGDYYHRKMNRFDDASQWCDANAIWHEFPEAVSAP